MFLLDEIREDINFYEDFYEEKGKEFFVDEKSSKRS